MADKKADVDIAIVGGGVSGVYSAWRLQEADPKRKIALFEGSGHIGGRLLSVRPPDIPNMVAELGGMRILPAVQPRITRLIHVLNDKLKPEKIDLYDFPVDQPQNIAYLRGVYLRLAEFTTQPDKVPYHLAFLERGDTAGRILVNAIERIVPGITNPNLDEYQRRQMARGAKFDGVPLWRQGFWNVLMRVISGEAYQLGVDAGGYNSTLTNWNAADAIPWFLADFGVNPEYKGFKKGFQEVPKALAKLFDPKYLENPKDSKIRLNTPVRGFDWVKDKGWFELRVPNGEKEKTVSAQSLILAMPRRSLDLLAPTSPPLRVQEVQDLIGSVTPRPLFKLFTTYSNPWWRAAGYTADGEFVPVESGRTVTDLPVRQTYYWPQDDGEPATEGPSMLMASYDDGTNIGFWDGLRPRRRRAWQEGLEVAAPDDPFVGDCDNQTNPEWCQYRPSKGMVAEVARQLATIHGLSYTPAVRNAAFRDWGDDPFGGGWNSWNIGVESWDVKTKIVKPDDARPLYICGEAYSDAQGWVEGALQTADMMLEKFGIGSL
jgi:monoamine oxidase